MEMKKKKSKTAKNHYQVKKEKLKKKHRASTIEIFLKMRKLKK